MGIQYRKISKKICKWVVDYCQENGILLIQTHIDLMRACYPFGKMYQHAYVVYAEEMERTIKKLRR